MALDVPMVLPALPPLATCKLDVLRFQIPASQVGMVFVVFGVGSIKLTSAAADRLTVVDDRKILIRYLAGIEVDTATAG